MPYFRFRAFPPFVSPIRAKFLGVISLVPNSLAVHTKEGKEYRFVLVGRGAWAEAIDASKIYKPGFLSCGLATSVQLPESQAWRRSLPVRETGSFTFRDAQVMGRYRTRIASCFSPAKPLRRMVTDWRANTCAKARIRLQRSAFFLRFGKQRAVSKLCVKYRDGADCHLVVKYASRCAKRFTRDGQFGWRKCT